MFRFCSGEDERTRPRDDQYKSHSKKSVIEVIDSPEDYADLDSNDKYKSVKYKQTDRQLEDPETIKRRAKFLDADREMTRRKEMAREELEARRELRREKRSSESPRLHKRSSHNKSHRQRHSPEDEASVINLSESDDDEDKR